MILQHCNTEKAAGEFQGMAQPASMNPALPPGCVTGVGSLPFIDPHEAVRFVAEHCPALPFWPQLPRRHPGEGVIAQGLGPLISLLEPATKPYCWRVRAGEASGFLRRLSEAEGCLSPETAAGFFLFEKVLQAGEFSQAVGLKAQAEGPVTLAHCLMLDDQSLVRQAGGLEVATSCLERHAVWQVRRLQQFGKPVIFVLDEPALALAFVEQSPIHSSDIMKAISAVLNAVRQAGAIAGLHCCAPLPAGMLTELNLDLLSFDAHLPVDSRGWFDLTHSVLARSGLLAFGLVPTTQDARNDPSELFSCWLRLASLTRDIQETAARTIVTATCGLGLVSPTATVSVFERCRQVGRLIEKFSQAT
jgi:hypothetical protein